MNLDDLANFVCGKVNQTETEDVAACKGFLKRRFLLLWAHALWKDSLVSYTQTISPASADYTPVSTWLPTKGVLLVPALIERVIAVRNDKRKLNVQRPEYYYRIDYDAFSKTGDPTDFVLQAPCVWEFDTQYSLTLRRDVASDADAVVTVDTLDSDGVSVTRTAQTMVSVDIADFAQTDRVDSVIKNATTEAIQLRAGDLQIVRLQATDTQAAKRQRIRFVVIPDKALTLRVAGKRSAPTFSDDRDEPALTGCENTLLALAQGDMLQRERHYAKAKACYDEAAILLEQLKTEEMVQMAHEQRIIPESGFGVDEWDSIYGFSF
jgi:hypothetical protein